ncbi:hypothetical protein [uncultured Rhodospira sp.]|uniref:hypothetical protein n=1 Tax=uncultured Rhodospira sp. TaxID=1936189 RepID=UPI002635F449|nr:hypothetical protein [uncultured Rhodospira sp.]
MTDDGDDTDRDEAGREDDGRRTGWPSRLTVVAVLFFVAIGLILAGVWMTGDLIMQVGRGMSILLLGVAFIIVLNVVAIVLMLVLLRSIRGRDE